MTKEDLILQRLDALDAKIDPIIKDRQKWAELREDLVPLQHQAVQLITEQLQEIEAGFQLEDLFAVMQQSMRSIKNFLFVIKTMDNLIEFIQDVEPLMKSAVPKMIEYMDELEQKGVFRMIKVMMDVRAKVAATYDPDDIERISDGLVFNVAGGQKNVRSRHIGIPGKGSRYPGQSGPCQHQESRSLWYALSRLRPRGQGWAGGDDGTDQGHGKNENQWQFNRRADGCFPVNLIFRQLRKGYISYIRNLQ